MDCKLNHRLLRLGWKHPSIRLLSSRRTVILLYHGIPKECHDGYIDASIFEQHIIFLKQHFEIVSPDRLWDRRQAHENIRVVLTFDDGFRNNAEVVAPILRKHAVPATFFVCSRHSVPGNYLWFTYLRALEEDFPGNGFHFRGEFVDMSPDGRDASIRQLSNFLLNLKPHPSAMYEAIEQELPRLEDFVSGQKLADCYAGMTAEQLGELATDPLFSVGVHTVDHPLLTKCEREEGFRQIRENKAWIERVCNNECSTIAYPSGDYNAELVEKCRELGFIHGYAVSPLLAAKTQLELPRIGVYSKSLSVLGFKVQWGNHMRVLRIKIG